MATATMTKIAEIVPHPSGNGFGVKVGKHRWISGGAGPMGGGDIGRFPTEAAAQAEATRLGYKIDRAPSPVKYKRGWYDIIWLWGTRLRNSPRLSLLSFLFCKQLSLLCQRQLQLKRWGRLTKAWLSCSHKENIRICGASSGLLYLAKLKLGLGLHLQAGCLIRCWRYCK